MKTNKSAFLRTSSLIFLVALFAVPSCGKSVETSSVFVPLSLKEDYEEPPLPTPSGEVVNVDDIDEKDNDIHTYLQLAAIASSYDKISSFAKGNKELSKPKAITFSVPNVKVENEFYIEVSETSDFKDSKLYITDSNKIDITNLKVGTTYYYRGSVNKNKLKQATCHTLTTENTLPRNIDVDGVTNVRDIGGYTSKLGGKIRQGLYYRGGRFNYTDEKTTIDEPSYFVNEVTEEGYETLTKTLGIKSEIDLRMNESHYQSTYAHEYGMMDNSSYPDIEYVAFPLNWNYSNMMTSEKETIGKIFKFMANKDNYPIYLHCNIGTDRSGMCTYLLGTLLGIEQEDLYRDYLFSNFGNINGSRDLKKITDIYQKTLLFYKEDNLYLDVREYLLDCEVTDQEMDNILNIFIDQSK